MLDDRRVIGRLKQGDREVLRQVYVSYKDTLLTLGYALLHDMNAAEDILHDVFVSFAGNVTRLELRTGLRQYLTTAVVNKVRDRYRRQKTRKVDARNWHGAAPTAVSAERAAVLSEETRSLTGALARLPLEQREVITLRLKVGMKFKEIAEIQKTSIATVQGRYRYAVGKLQALLGGDSEE
jgi:RNA polymerase sigma-70 factor (ECF subfamily)